MGTPNSRRKKIRSTENLPLTIQNEEFLIEGACQRVLVKMVTDSAKGQSPARDHLADSSFSEELRLPFCAEADMQVTERDLTALELLLIFGYLVTGQIKRLVFPGDKDGSVARDRLRKLEAAGWIQRRRAEVANPLNSNTVPVWIITHAGICQLALLKDNPQLLNQHPPCTRTWQNFCHYVAVSDLMIKIHQAVDSQKLVALNGMFFEHTVVNPEVGDPDKRYKLYSIVSAPTAPRKIICAPDAAFELQVGKFRCAYYLELERGTDTPPRIAAKKSSGYNGLFESKKWKLHFPEAQQFRVICVLPTASWIKPMLKAIKDKPSANLWMFMALDQLTPESFLHGLIVHTTQEAPRPLIRPPAGPPVGG